MAAQDKGHSTWSKYREKHRWQRITDFAGMTPPKKVRIYRRNDRYLLDWWDRSVNGHLRQPVDGDLADAVVAARKIDEHLLACKTSGRAKQKVSHAELVEAYLADIQSRVDAGQLATATPGTYKSALAHYVTFIEQPTVAHRYDRIGRVDRNFAREFAAFLNDRRVSRNGRGEPTGRMRSADKVLNTVRQMYNWAVRAEQPRLLPAGFENPFHKGITGRSRGKALAASQPLALTTAMAGDLLMYIRHQGAEHDLALFATILLGGMALPSRRCSLPIIYATAGWASATCPNLLTSPKARRTSGFRCLAHCGNCFSAPRHPRACSFVGGRCSMKTHPRPWRVSRRANWLSFISSAVVSRR